MPADPALQAIPYPLCGENIQLDEVTVHQLADPLRSYWEEEFRRQVEAGIRASYEEELKDYRTTIRQLETKVRRLEDQLDRVCKALTDAQRKARTGSQTEEGYARQDLFAEELRRQFTDDSVTVTPRGMAGAAVLQGVRDGKNACGTILWEVKRASSWQAEWVPKLAGERDNAGALIGVIVSETVPSDMESFGRVGDVWVCSFDVATTISGVLRELVVTAWKYELAAAKKANDAEKVYNYVMTGDFGRRFEGLSRVAADLLHDLELDKRALDQRWNRTKRRIQEILVLRDAIPGDLIDVIGADAELPAALQVELPAGGMDGELMLPPGGNLRAG